MDSSLVLLGVGALIGVFLGVGIVRFWLVPWNKASFLRSVTGKNWAVVGVRSAGGQTRWRVVKLDTPIFSFNNRTYEADENLVNYHQSVPFWLFHEDDVKPIDLSGKETSEYWRNPKHLNAGMMMLKSLFETLSIKDKKTLMLIAGLTLAIAIGGAIAGYMAYQEATTVKEEVLLLKSMVGNMSSVVHVVG